MNNSIVITTVIGNMRIKASIDGRGGADYDNPMPKRISEETELHFHTLFELFFALDGELVVKDTRGRHSYFDRIVSIPPFYEHAVISDPSRFRILFELSEKRGAGGKDIHLIMKDILTRGAVALHGSERIKFCVEEIKRAIKRTDALVREELEPLLKLLFLSIYNENTERREGERIGMENYLIVIDDCISSHLADDVTISYVAKRLHLSYRQTARIIKANYKEPLHEIITQKRLAKAKKLLSTTDSPISEIALSVGFVSESYFFKLFKKTFGMTPKSFRNTAFKNMTSNL